MKIRSSAVIPETHSILLLNFTEREAGIVRKAGFNVELGFIGGKNGYLTGRTTEPEPLFPYFFPRPLYEYDVLVFNSVYDKQGLAEQFPSLKTGATLNDTMMPVAV